MNKPLHACALAALGLLAQCKQSEPAAPDADAPVVLDDAGYQVHPGNPDDAAGYVWRLPVGFPKPIVPAHNPMSEAKVQLGRMLFYDRRLSRNAALSCASCHQQRAAFADARGVSHGLDGAPHPRSAPSLANAAYHARYNWADPRLEQLEQMLRGPLFGENTPIVEMGLDSDEHRAAALSRLLADARYRQAFAAAFGDAAPDAEQLILALACFLRTIVSGNSPADRAARGDLSALSPSAQLGKQIFETHYGGAVCHHCHSGVTLSNDVRHERLPLGEFTYTNIGLYNVDGAGSYPAGNQGLFESSGKPNDRGRFRTPTIRNVALTAPYMHDGSAATLRDVLEHYQEGGRNLTAGPHRGDGRTSPLKEAGINGMILEEHEMQALEDFLHAFTDPVLLSDPRFANPFPDDPHFGE